MAQIEYEVSNKAITPERLGTTQLKTLYIIEKFDKPKITRVGSYTSSMDQKSGKGTLVAAYETFNISILFDDEEIPRIDEMLYSLMDYQKVKFYGVDIPKLGRNINFTMIEDSWSFSSAGCQSNRLSFSGKILS